MAIIHAGWNVLILFFKANFFCLATYFGGKYFGDQLGTNKLLEGG